MLVNLRQVRHERLVPRHRGKASWNSCMRQSRDVIARRGAVSPGEGIIPLREMPRFSLANTYAGRVYRRR